MTRAAPLAAALLVAASGCCSCLGTPTFTVRRGAALHPPPAPPPLAGPTVRALHVADFGERTCQQDAVAGAAIAAHRRSPFQLALFPGDNLYPCGASAVAPGAAACAFAADDNTVAPGFAPPDDPSFRLHEEPLAPLAEAPAVATALALGNHDVFPCGGDVAPAVTRLQACLEVAHRSALWRMPGRHYLVDEGPARFIVVDSNLLAGDYGGFALDDEVAFVAAAAQDCGTRVCFLVGHHPPVTAGSHRATLGSAPFVERADALLAAGGGRIRAFLAGHDHDLQHLRTGSGVDVLVSGNGSGARAAETFDRLSRGDAQLFFASVRWGYGVLEVGASGWRYRFEGDDGAPLYCCAAEGAAPCEPVSCR